MTLDTRIAAGTANVALLTVPALAVASWITLPASQQASAVVSTLARAGYGSWTNYLQFAALAGLLALAFLIGYRRGTSLVMSLGRALSGDDPLARWLNIALWCAVAVAAAAYAVNASISSVTHPLVDFFHEGEYLGFVPHLRAGGTLAGTLMTHGPGVDLLPAYASVGLAGPINGIAVARIVYSLLRVVAVVAAAIGLALLCRLLASGASRTRWIVTTMLAALVLGAALRVGEWPDEPPLHKTLNPRDAVYLAQIALVLAFVRASNLRPVASRTAFLMAFLAGATLPWAILYCYDRGLYGIAFVALVTLPIAVSSHRARWLTGGLAGVAAGLTALFVTVPRSELAVVAEQMQYWMRYGRDLWSTPGIATPSEPWIPILLAGATASLGCAVVRTVRSAREHGVAAVVFREPAAVVMLAASLPLLRTAIERGDGTHVAWAVTPAWMLAAAWLANLACSRFLWPDDAPAANGDAKAIGAVLVSVLVGFSLPLMDPVAAARRVDREYLRGWHAADTSVLTDAQRKVQAAMKPAMKTSPCFVTLTNESTWHYILDRPSCTRFHYMTNARPGSAQDEVVGALEAKRPEWILVGSPAWSNVVDGVSFFDASPTIAAYVLTHYEPDAFVAGNWFWRRTAQPPAWSDERIGQVRSHPPVATRAADARIDGVVPADAALRVPSALLLTTGEPPRPVWTGRPDERSWREGAWSATIPTAAFAAGAHRLQAWARRDAPARWIRLGDEIEVRMQ